MQKAKAKELSCSTNYHELHHNCTNCTIYYKNQFGEILALIKSTREQVLKTINIELIDLNWSIGKYISESCTQNNWDQSTVENLSKFIKEQEPEIKGFSPQNLWRMKQFYEAYYQDEILAPLVREI